MAAPYRFLRLNITGTVDGTFSILWELDYSADSGSTWLPTVAMTSNGGPSPLVASASSEFGGFPAYLAFDNNNGTRWTSGAGTLPQSITIDLGAGNEVQPNRIRWRTYNTGGIDASITAGTVQGANISDFSDAATLLSFSGLGTQADGTNVTLTINQALTLTAAAGAYTLTGIAAALLKGKLIVADAGAYVLTGIAAVFHVTLKMPAAAGAYVLTGIAAITSFGRKMAAAVGAYTLTGQDVTLFVAEVFTLVAGAGSYVLTGLATIMARAIRNTKYLFARRARPRLKDTRAQPPVLKE